MILSLQYLRGIAALLVVAFHASEYLARAGGRPSGFPFTAGVSGVDVFFVISGFVITWSSVGTTISPLVFLWKRVVRIVPLYWILTLAVTAVALLRPALLNSTVFDGGHLVASLMFWPIGHPVLDETLPVLIPGWTLNYEMAFYVVFALSLLLPSRARIPAVLAVLVLAVSLRQVIPYRIATAFYTMPLILEFGAGMIIAKLYGSHWRLSRHLAAFAFILGWAALLSMAGTGLWRSVASGIPATMIVGGAVFFERERALPALRLLMVLGDASYSIYLTHVLTMPVLAKLWALASIPSSPFSDAAFIMLALSSSALAGILVYRLIERPLLRVMRPRPARSSAVSGMAAATADDRLASPAPSTSKI